MNRSRGLRAAAFLAGSLVLATAGVARAAEPEPRVVTVSGRAEQQAAPDRATVTLGVSAHAATIEAARAGVNRVVPALLALTHDLGIAEAQVRSTRIDVQPDYTWNSARSDRRITGYGVQRQLVVQLRDLERLGELLEKSVSAGANVVGEPMLDSSRRSEIEREALTHAVDDARQNAQALAGALGATVGPARRVAMGGAGGALLAQRGVVSAPARNRMSSSEAPETYQPGELSFSASVEVTFDLVTGTVAR